jgi:nicotinate-nucleotide pyrophosphorylase (carboxylating)
MLDSFAHSDLLLASLPGQVQRALAEDVGSGDITAALIDPADQACARIISREAGVFCGEPYVSGICAESAEDIEIAWQVQDGETVAPNALLFTLTGSARALLTLERTLLNFVQMLSGTATLTRHYARLIERFPTRLLDTRKTIPGLRLAQKYAVHCGGGHNHRIGLFDAYLLKENHLAAAGGIGPAVRAARTAHPDLQVEVEVETLDQLQQAIAAGAHIALLDNFTLAQTQAAVAQAAGHIKLEASGGITEESITEIAATGVDYISTGIITKQIMPLDLSMRFVD